MSINRVVLVGRLGNDPELRTTTTSKTVASFNIAVQGRSKDQVFWFKVQCWERTAEYVSNYLTKGRLVAVEGRLETRKFTDKDGNNRESTEVIADNVQGLDRPKEETDTPKYEPTGGHYDPFE